MPDLVLTPAELAALTGYRRPCAQLAELHRLGFHRARRAPVSGAVMCGMSRRASPTSRLARSRHPWCSSTCAHCSTGFRGFV